MIDISEVNSKLKTERRANQSVTRGQVECAKLTRKVKTLTAQVDKLATGLEEASAKLAKAKPSPSKPTDKKRIQTSEESARLEKLYLAKEERKRAATNLVRK
jgi:hypothetical protein